MSYKSLIPMIICTALWIAGAVIFTFAPVPDVATVCCWIGAPIVSVAFIIALAVCSD